ncbi:MAG: cytochrome c [Pseudomonadota bacterium]
MKNNTFYSAWAIAALIGVGTNSAVIAGDADAGKAIVAEKCAVCHGADGNSEIPVNPVLAGQYESYLIQALSDYRSGARQNATMAGFAADLSDKDIRDLAAYLSSQDSDLEVLER